MKLKELLKEMLKAIQRQLEDDDCDIPDDIAIELLKIGERIREGNAELTKAQVADRLHCTTKTVERYVKRGDLCKGHKRPGLIALYWKPSDVTECKRRLGLIK